MKIASLFVVVVAGVAWFFQDVLASWGGLVVFLAGRDLTEFSASHRRLYAEAEINGNYSNGILHYYSVMGPMIDAAVGKYLHFVPDEKGLSQRAKHSQWQALVASKLGLRADQTLCEIGCGMCHTGRGVAASVGATFVGLTMSPVEVQIGREDLKKSGREHNSSILQGDYLQMPLKDGACDALLAVYTLKYSHPDTKLREAFKEISRVLRPGGRFASYEILNSDTYDSGNATHTGWSHRISYHTGMPPLASMQYYREVPPTFGLKLREEVQVETLQTYRTIDSYPFYMYSGFIKWPEQMCSIAGALERLGLKAGLREFCDFVFVHPAKDIHDSIEAGSCEATTLFTYERA